MPRPMGERAKEITRVSLAQLEQNRLEALSHGVGELAAIDHAIVLEIESLARRLEAREFRIRDLQRRLDEANAALVRLSPGKPC